MGHAPKILLAVTAVVTSLVGCMGDNELKCDEAISAWRLALSKKDLGQSQLDLAATLGKEPTKAAIINAASNDTKERSEMEKACSPARYLNALETAAAEERIDRMTGQ
jgi:hypothetical protein